ncbi:MAG: Hsp90 cochaperone [Vezdaea aestivalis]|nr:MAG: Hsp90 cochaperone [Vezdaea aestivalis]
MADALKAEGNKAFVAKDYPEAIDKFSKAIELDPTNHVLYSNRSACYASLKDFPKASDDAVKTTELKPEWSKGWGRKGAALHGLRDLEGSKAAYEKALELDSSNAQAKSGLSAVERALESEAMGGMGGDLFGGLSGFFKEPQLSMKLSSSDKTRHLIQDEEFMTKLRGIATNPASFSDLMTSGDQRISAVLGALMGIDVNMSEQPEGTAADMSARQAAGEDVTMPDAPSSSSSKPSMAPRPPPREPTPEPEDEEAIAAKKAKAAADAEKALGTASYKKRDFDTAIAHYTKAWEIHKDITYLTNLSAAKFEKGDYEGAISACQEAVTEGRQILTDFKIIAKAFGRIGSSYEKLNDLTNAIEYYQRSLTEHRTPDILAKLRAAQKAKIIADKTAYIDPTKAEAAREEGNLKFKEADWAGAVSAYSEMVQRAPEDPRGYSNRAAAFIKLMTFPSAVEDCDEALKRDPKFVRAYLRKAQALFAMRKYTECIETTTAATQADEGGKNAREINEQQQKAMSAMYSRKEGETEDEVQQRIQNDPEILKILGDPVMQSILQQAKSNPAALQEHMKNPTIAGNIHRLIGAGVIRLGRE